MARQFEYSLDRRIINRLIIWLVKQGKGPEFYYLLTVPGRKTGQPHTVPVALVFEGSTRWLVAPYGSVDWVKNARAAGWVTLSRGDEGRTFKIRELSDQDAARILKLYLSKYPITKSYFNARADSALDVFVQEAHSRPVFELIPQQAIET